MLTDQRCWIMFNSIFIDIGVVGEWLGGTGAHFPTIDGTRQLKIPLEKQNNTHSNYQELHTREFVFDEYRRLKFDLTSYSLVSIKMPEGCNPTVTIFLVK